MRATLLLLPSLLLLLPLLLLPLLLLPLLLLPLPLLPLLAAALPPAATPTSKTSSLTARGVRSARKKERSRRTKGDLPKCSGISQWSMVQLYGIGVLGWPAPRQSGCT